MEDGRALAAAGFGGGVGILRGGMGKEGGTKHFFDIFIRLFISHTIINKYLTHKQIYLDHWIIVIKIH